MSVREFGLLLSILVLSSSSACSQGSEVAKLLVAGEKLLLPIISHTRSIGDLIQFSNISSGCKSDLLDLIDGIKAHKTWAIQSKF